MSHKKLSPDQADVLEEILFGPAWVLVLDILDEKIEQKTRSLKTGRLDHDDYIRACESIRTAEYLRERPKQLIAEARMGTHVHS